MGSAAGEDDVELVELIANDLVHPPVDASLDQDVDNSCRPFLAEQLPESV